MSTLPPLRGNHGLYALSWHSAQDGKLVVDTDQLTIVDANPAAEKMTGFAWAELLGMELTALTAEKDHAKIRNSTVAMKASFSIL